MQRGVVGIVGNAVRTDEGQRGGATEALIAQLMADIDPGFEGEGHRPEETALDIREGSALEIDRFEGVGPGGDQPVTVELIRVDGDAGRAVGHGDSPRAKIKNVVERNRQARATRDRIEERAFGGVLAPARGLGVAETDFRLPDRAAVPVGERGHVEISAEAIHRIRDLHVSRAREASG